jgi:hypothetical protein
VNSKPHYSQESPMFATVDFVAGDNNYWGISLYRIINIKTTAAAKITEFSSKAYSTKPMVTERLILHYNNNDKVNDNYWYTKDSTDSYSFNYKSADSDRCWDKTADNKVSIKGGTIDYTDYTLNVKL